MAANLYEAKNKTHLPAHELRPGNSFFERLVVVLDDPVDRLAEHGLHLRLVQLVDTGGVEGGGKAGVSGRTGTAFYLEYTGQDCLHWQFKIASHQVCSLCRSWYPRNQVADKVSLNAAIIDSLS